MTTALDQHFALLQQSLDLRAYRQQLLAANMANADTPNYKAVDLDFSAALRGALSSQGQGQGQAMPLATDNTAQLQPQSQGEPAAAFVAYQAGNSVRLDGNSVNMNREQAAFARNSLQYEADLTFITGKIKTLASAITG
jgi:flagellar basal-body rod protein FlgB